LDKTSPNSKISGFTLIEVLLTIAIITIVMAVTIPVVFDLRSSLQMHQLDASARHIFIASQNQLTALRNSGDLSAFSAVTPLLEEPSDYTGTDWLSLSYLSSSEPSHAAALSLLLPDGSVDSTIKNGNYVVELDLNSGSIYAVFYSEESCVYTSDLPRERKARAANTPLVGYYGGNVLEGALQPVTPLPNPQITVTNSEILSISFSTDNPFSDITDGNFFSDLAYFVTVSSQTDSSKSHTFSSDTIPSPFTRNLYSYSLLLDSLITGEQFKDICPDITPGETVTITVTAHYASSDGIYLSSSSAVSVNSLFAARSDNEVSIAYARHLQNIEPSVSGVVGVTSAIQTAAIDWSYYDEDFVPIANLSLTSYDGNGLAISQLTVGTSAAPVQAGLFGEFPGGTISNIRLINPSIRGGTYSGGLVGYCNAALTIENAALYITDLTNASNYQVYGTRYVGGLIGYCQNLSILNSFAAPASVRGAVSNGDIGGLIGYCGASSVVSGCYANTDVFSTASPDIGGLIGQFSGTKIINCYAVGDLTALASNRYGGLVGNSTDVTYSNCYTAVTFEGAGDSATPFGFSGSNLNHTSNCVSLKNSDYTLGTPNSSVLPVSYSELKAWRGGTAWTNAVWSNTHPYSAELLSAGAPYPFQRLKALEHYNDWPEEEVPSFDYSAFFAYYETYQDGTNGYHALDADGVVALNTLSNDKGALTDDGYVFLSSDPLTSSERNFYYRDAEHWSVDIGMRSITANGVSTQYYRYAIPDYELNWNDTFQNPVSFYEPIQIAGQFYWFCPNFSKSVVNGDTAPAFNGTVYVRSTRQLSALGAMANSFYSTSNFHYLQELDLDFDINPYNFMDGVGYSSATSFRGSYDGLGKTIIVNSESSSWDKALFRYNAGTVQNVNIRTSGSFAMGIGGEASGVLCGSNSGTIQNCTVTYGTNFSSRGAPFGTIAGNNSGTITSCRVTTVGFSTLTGDSNTVAGFVGQNSGSITDCSVRPGVSHYAGLTLTGAERSAGFVYDNSGSIQRCFVVGTIRDAAYWGCVSSGFVYNNSGAISNCYSNTVVNGFHAAGFAYLNNIATSSIQNCYAMVSVSSNQNNGNAAGFVFAGNTLVQKCYTAAQVTGRNSYTFSSQAPSATCYYLNWPDCGTNTTGTGLSRNALYQIFSADSANWGGADTYVYRDLYPDLPDACTFPLISGLDHYGDWPPAIMDIEHSVGVFYYEKSADNVYYISAAALQYRIDTSPPQLLINKTMVSFIKDYFDVSAYLSTHTLSDSGYGAFWIKNIDQINSFEINDVRLRSLNTARDLGLNDNYYFVPFDDAADIRYSHDSSGKRTWTVTFTYDKASDTFTATIS